MNGVSLAARGILWLLRPKSEREPDDGLRILMVAIAGVFLAVIMLFSLIAYVLTSPIEFLGILGEFQLAYADQFSGYGSAPGTEAIDEEYIEHMVAGISDPERQDVVREALSLVGRVSYFWGGKSGPGWNDEWGELKIVTSPGVSSTGKIRPYGLDCSGYVAWAFSTAGVTDELAKGGTGWQWSVTRAIRKEDLQPGDLAFKQPPTETGINHVGIYYGEDEQGRPLYLHCSAGDGGVVLNVYAGFQYFRRLPGD